MVRTLIINLIVNVFKDNKNNREIYYEKLLKEYSNITSNPDLDIYFLILSSTKDDKINYISKKLDYTQVGNLISSVLSPSDILANEKALDLGTVEDLVKVFNEIDEKEKYTNKILLTWDHGYGYTMFKDTIGENDLTESQRIILSKFKEEYNNSEVIRNLFNNFTEEFNFDVKEFFDLEISNQNSNGANNNDIVNKKIYDTFLSGYTLSESYDLKLLNKKKFTTLTIFELSQAIKRSSIKKFDLVIMSNCYMQTIDTFYSLRDCTKYIISPQTSFPWESYDFGSIIPLRNKTIDDEFCKNILSKTKESMEALLPIHNLNLHFNVSIDEISFSCIKTEKQTEFFNSIKIICDELLEIYYEKDKEIYRAKDQIEDITNITNPKRDLSYKSEFKLFQKDLYFLLKFLQMELQNNKIIYSACNSIFDLVDNNDIILDRVKGSLLDWDSNTKIKYAARGISIFFPNTRYEYENSKYGEAFIMPESIAQTEFSKEFGWGNFLERFFNQYS
jgi:hypothetical protein